jgi:23S rRNA (uracil1939-C5)-methyltransferase
MEIEVRIEKLVAGGDGLARCDGLPIFVPRAAPGDHLRVRIVKRKTGYARGEIQEIIDSGASRREPPCPHFGECGGCDLQHIKDESQATFKAEAALETLQRLGRLDLRGVKCEVIAGESWSYRLRTQLRTALRTDGVALGYFARGTQNVISVKSCPVLVPELEGVLQEPFTLDANPPLRIDLAAGDDLAITSSPSAPDWPQGAVQLQTGAFSFQYDARCFFQTHRHLLGRLTDSVVGEWKGSRALDLYAGVGFFSLPLAGYYEEVVAVEGDRVAARFARNNSRRNRLRNITITHMAVESWIKNLPSGIDRILVDPPRGGLAPVVRKALVSRPATRLTYASCDAATLARDLKDLTKVYRPESIVFLDMFPQTGHIETVVQLKESPLA